jgi:small subunit ribosomal protein S4
MGQTKKIRKKYETPAHPWQKERIIEEKEYLRTYGFKNKKEIWKEVAKLKKARLQAKKVIADKSSEQANKEKEQLLTRLVRFGLLTKDSKLEDVLGLKSSDFFERRLQTLVFKKGLARSPKQARQFIVHGHVVVNNKKVTAPSYMVSLEEESKIIFSPISTISKADHPERAILKKKDKEVLEEIKPKKEVVKVEDKKEAPKIADKKVEDKKEETKVEEAVKEEPKPTEVTSK